MIDTTKLFLQAACHHAQHGVPDRMAVGVVDHLELVQIGEDNRQGYFRTSCPFQFERYLAHVIGPIVDLGQTVHVYTLVDFTLMPPTTGDETGKSFSQSQQGVPVEIFVGDQEQQAGFLGGIRRLAVFNRLPQGNSNRTTEKAIT